MCSVSLNPEERARIYSSDSDEGSDDDKAQRLMKAKKLDSDEVSVIYHSAHRWQCGAKAENPNFPHACMRVRGKNKTSNNKKQAREKVPTHVFHLQEVCNY